MITFPDTTVPSVSITAPTANSNVKGAVTITASASDDIGVTKVEFYLDGVLLNTDMSAPYSFNWSTLSTPSGSHTLTAKAYDAASNVGTSAAVGITVRRVPNAPWISKLE